MSHIDDLVKELCPNGVEWKELGAVFDTKNGYTPAKSNKEYWSNGTVPWFRMEDIRMNGRILDKSIQYVSQTAVKGGKLFKANSIIVATSATIGEHALITVPFLSNQRFTVLTPKENLEDKINMKFIYHYCFLLDEWCKNNVSMSSFASVDMVGFKKFKIPLPPLKIQEEIVKTLDKFTEYVTELTAELTAELTFRKKQYSFYRDKLLSFEDEVYQVEWKKLGDICQVYDGTHQTPNYRLSGIPFVSVENINDLYSTTKYISEEDYQKYKIKPQKNDVFMTRIGSVGTCTVVNRDDDLAYYVSLALLRPDEEILNSYYLKYFIESTYGRRELNKRILHNAIPIKVNMGDIGKIKLPVPPLAIQERIVYVLDHFDTVCHDLNIGLPKEIELRQKQYAFFRDKLLTFAAEGVYTDSTVQYSNWVIVLLQWVFGTIRVELGTVCEFTRGNGLQKKDFTETGYPVIHYGQVYTKYGFSTDSTVSFADQAVFDKLKKAKPSDIIMATTSENVEDVGKALVWEGQEDVGISGDAYVISTSQNARFINYYFKSVHFQMQKEKKVTGTKVIRINARDMERFLITLPPLSEQAHIVSILDRFDILTNDLSQGLPREIEQREKQYAYFRDKLLTF